MTLSTMIHSKSYVKLSGNTDGGEDIIGTVGVGHQGDLLPHNRQHSLQLGVIGRVLTGLLGLQIVPGLGQKITQQGQQWPYG